MAHSSASGVVLSDDHDLIRTFSDGSFRVVCLARKVSHERRSAQGDIQQSNINFRDGNVGSDKVGLMTDQGRPPLVLNTDRLHRARRRWSGCRSLPPWQVLYEMRAGKAVMAFPRLSPVPSWWRIDQAAKKLASRP